MRCAWPAQTSDFVEALDLVLDSSFKQGGVSLKRQIAFGLACLLLAGCETTRVSPEKAAQVPADDIFAFGKPTSASDARIVFTQDAGALSCFGAGMQVFLNERLAAETSSGKSVKLYHKPGPVQLSIKNNAACAGGDLRGMLLDLKPGYSYSVRGYRGMWDKAEPLLTSPEPYKYR
ncbi:hypothetical protein DMX03_25355 [Pseudomonas koreensis]|nr:hypothetical protein DMX03_25355 [Pseudomonas koreensis]